MQEDTFIMAIKEIEKGLTDRSLGKVKKATGLSYPTLKRLADGEMANYTIRTLITVSNYLNK